MQLDEQVVVVTGGTKGVGRGIVTRFLEAGAKVVVTARNEPDEPLLIGGNEPSFVAADVRDPDQCEAVVAHAVDLHGRLDVLVNNAGGSPQAEAATASPRFSEAIVRLNLLAPLHLSQAANRVMQDQGAGAIVNIASVSGTRPSPWTAAYGAAKAGLLNLTASLAMEWAPAVRVNAVIAGYVATEQAFLHYGDDEGMARVAAEIPMGRLATPSDIGDACLFLASPLASYITGASIAVHGGGEQPPFLSARESSR